MFVESRRPIKYKKSEHVRRTVHPFVRPLVMLLLLGLLEVTCACACSRVCDCQAQLYCDKIRFQQLTALCGRRPSVILSVRLCMNPSFVGKDHEEPGERKRP